MQHLKVLLSLLIIIGAVLGMADAGYLTYEKLAGVIPQCAPGFDCGKVLNSPWASVGPIPLSALGLSYYTTMLIAGVLQYLQIIKPRWLLFLSSAGFVFSLSLVFLMGVVIQAWCFYCLISAGISTTLFVLSAGLHWISRHEPDSV